MVPIERIGKPDLGCHHQQGPQKGQFRAPSDQQMTRWRVQDQDVTPLGRCMPISADQGVGTIYRRNKGCQSTSE